MKGKMIINNYIFKNSASINLCYVKLNSLIKICNYDVAIPCFHDVDNLTVSIFLQTAATKLADRRNDNF